MSHATSEFAEQALKRAEEPPGGASEASLAQEGGKGCRAAGGEGAAG